MAGPGEGVSDESSLSCARRSRRLQPLYEYACHEGNYGMTNILAGSRAAEAGGQGR